MLAGVDKDRLNLRMARISRMRGAIFGRLGAGADDIQDFEALAHGVFVFGFDSQYRPGDWAFGRA